MFRDKFVLVMLVLGLLTIVAAAGAVTIRRGGQKEDASPYLELPENGGMIAEEHAGGQNVAGNSNAAQAPEEVAVSHSGQNGNAAGTRGNTSAAGSAHEAADASDALAAGVIATESLALDYTDAEKLAWPVQGNVILGYSMDTTTWFPTLEQYKVNPANLIQSDVSTPVSAPADARVLEVGVNEEIGNFVRLDLGNEYTVVCGQLKEVPVVVDEYLHRGDLLGYVAEPTKYYSVEGNNLYFEFLHAGEPVDALDYLE